MRKHGPACVRPVWWVPGMLRCVCLSEAKVGTMDEYEARHRGAERLPGADHPEPLTKTRGETAAVADMSGARADSVRPVEVPGPLGTPISLETLPPPDTRRWVVRRKAEVIAAIRGGLLTAAEACARYRLSPEELELWQESIDRAGVPGLRVTRIQLYKDYVAPPPRQTRPSQPSGWDSGRDSGRESGRDDGQVRDLSRSWSV